MSYIELQAICMHLNKEHIKGKVKNRLFNGKKISNC